jgi:hypothetical protein
MSRLREPSPTCLAVTPISPFSGGPLPDTLADSDLPTGRTPLRDGAINPPNRGDRSASDFRVDRPMTPVNGTSAAEGETADDENTGAIDENINVVSVADPDPETTVVAASKTADLPDACCDNISTAVVETSEAPVNDHVNDAPKEVDAEKTPQPPATVSASKDDEDFSVWNFKPRPPPPRRFGDKHKIAGATLVRIARGFLGRMYAKSVAMLVHEYIDQLIERHMHSPNKQAANQRPLVHTLLQRFENDETVAKAKQKMLVTDLADEVLEFALHTSAVPEEEEPQEIVIAVPTPTGNDDDCHEDIAVDSVRVLADDQGGEKKKKNKKRHMDDEERLLAASLVLQRSIRMLLAKAKLARLREARRLRWEERRDDSGDNLLQDVDA